MTHVGRYIVESLLRSMELVGLAPTGTARTPAELADGGDALVAGEKEGLFTPMYLMVGRKPVV
jgi:sterol 24-C-methyltransferase